ncbi:phage terminase large subunit family protein [Bradyrhizobium sp. 150]|uniref:phage terminase large subunit family protein n=1 Tax=Bradyrhizobium sp. 150 TaxID=2782625 RepID=UPI0031F5F841
MQRAGLMLYVMPTTESARRNVRTRIDPLIESTPTVCDRVTKARSRDPGNTATLNRWPWPDRLRRRE